MLYQDLAWIGGGGFEAKSLQQTDDIATFTGVASTADKDLTRDIIEPGAFGNVKAADVCLLRDHRPDQVIGGWRKFRQEGKHLEVEGAITLATEKGRETVALMRQGFLTGLSVGFVIEPGGASFDEDKGIRRIKSATLLECSVVSIPANRRARVRNVKSMSREDTRQWLSDNGLRDEEIEIVMAKGFDALIAEPRLRITEIDGFCEHDDAVWAGLAAEAKRLREFHHERLLP